MFKWVAETMGLGAARMHVDEAKKFVEQLKMLNEADIKSLASAVAEYRAVFESKGVDVGHPLEYIKLKPGIITRFEAFLEDLSRLNEPVRIMAISVWLHTLRAAHALKSGGKGEEYRQICKDMWRTLAPSSDARSGSDFFPKGFEPSP